MRAEANRRRERERLERREFRETSTLGCTRTRLPPRAGLAAAGDAAPLHAQAAGSAAVQQCSRGSEPENNNKKAANCTGRGAAPASQRHEPARQSRESSRPGEECDMRRGTLEYPLQSTAFSMPAREPA